MHAWHVELCVAFKHGCLSSEFRVCSVWRWISFIFRLWLMCKPMKKHGSSWRWLTQVIGIASWQVIGIALCAYSWVIASFLSSKMNKRVSVTSNSKWVFIIMSSDFFSLVCECCCTNFLWRKGIDVCTKDLTGPGTGEPRMVCCSKREMSRILVPWFICMKQDSGRQSVGLHEDQPWKEGGWCCCCLRLQLFACQGQMNVHYCFLWP